MIDAGPRNRPPLGAQLAAEIHARATTLERGGSTEFRLRLDPPELGTIRVHLTATENSLTARVVVSHESIRPQIEAYLHDLRHTLADAGLSLGQFDVRRDANADRESWEPLPAMPGTPTVSPRQSIGESLAHMWHGDAWRPGRIDVLA